MVKSERYLNEDIRFHLTSIALSQLCCTEYSSSFSAKVCYGYIHFEYVSFGCPKIRGMSTKQVPFANIAAAALRSRRCACVQNILVRWEGTDTICRQSNRVYALSCVFTIFKKFEKPAACEMRSVISFLNARNMKLADIHRQLCEVYGEHGMSDFMVRRWVRHFNERRENVHHDPRSCRPSVVNRDLVRAVENSREQTIHHFVTFSAFPTNFTVTSSRRHHSTMQGYKNWCHATTGASTMMETMSKSNVRYVYIKWQYKWFGNKFLFFFNSPSELTFCITCVYST
jgi:hypothetical protein